MKKIPYGIGSFDKIIKEGYYYVDKTRFIELIESLDSEYLFFLRPRRFGKSLFISMLEHYYDVLKRDEFEELFSETYIGRNPTGLRNSFPVLKFNFSGIPITGDVREAERSFDLSVKRAIRVFLTNYSGLYSELKKVKDRVLNLEKAGDIIAEFIQSLYELGIRYYLLIDEYDNFANNILLQYGKGDYRGITHAGGFLRSFFAVIKNGTETRTIEKLFATGVTPLVLSDITSGMNIGDNISGYPDFEDMVGFTDEEVEGIVDYYISEGEIRREDRDKLLSILEEYSDNYYFSRKLAKRVHNSDMVFYIIKSYIQFKGMPDDPIDPNIRSDYERLKFLVVESNRLNGNFNILEEVLDKGEIAGKLVNTFALDELRDETNFISLLYYLGLLSIKGLTMGGRYIYNVPNITVRTLLWEYIRKALGETYGLRLNVRYIEEQFEGMAFRGE